MKGKNQYGLIPITCQFFSKVLTFFGKKWRGILYLSNDPFKEDGDSTFETPNDTNYTPTKKKNKQTNNNNENI